MFLTDAADVWSQNAWDHVPPPDDQAGRIAAALARQQAAPVPDADKPKYNDRPARHWSVPPIAPSPSALSRDLGMQG
jgi:tRNAThr (cytosine32-N3)-methyltransferase